MAREFAMFPSPDPRIYCLAQSTDAHPGLATGVAPPGLLSAAEQSIYAGFKMAKRRRDWLLGRWTAKHLIWSYLAPANPESVPLDRIEILADDDGAPYARLGVRLELSLSISHSGSESFCAVCPAEAGHVGADVEQVESRDLSFVRTFFTSAENAAVDVASAVQRDVLVTALWSTKEAVLKTLRLGLRADTRQLDVRIGDLAAYWSPVAIAVDPTLLASPGATFAGWCLVRAARVFSLALLAPS